MPDPPGRLLTVREREGRVVHLLGIAVALLLLNKGWQLHSQPGVFKFEKDGEDFPVFAIVDDVLTGAITPDRTGEVMVAMNGGVQAFMARDADGGSIDPYEEVVVVDRIASRTVLVTRLYEGDPAS